jgi:FkbM family methyltransferase
MTKSFDKFLEKIRSSNIEGAYSLLLGDYSDPSDIAIAEELKKILTSHFIRQRQSKFNGLFNLKRSGFNPDFVIDVGAQTGTPELYNTFPDSRHIFIEPVNECLDALNKIAKSLTHASILNCAVSNFNGESNISLTDSKQYSSIDEVIGSDNRIIEVKTIDSICEEFQITGQVLLKIDVDGPEVKVLQGSKKLLKQGCVIVIEASMADEKPRFSQVVEYLSSYDYQVFDIVDPLFRQSDWHLWQVDLILIKKDSPLWGPKTYI